MTIAWNYEVKKKADEKYKAAIQETKELLLLCHKEDNTMQIICLNSLLSFRQTLCKLIWLIVIDLSHKCQKRKRNLKYYSIKLGAALYLISKNWNFHKKGPKPGYCKYFDKFAWKCAANPDKNFRELLFSNFSFSSCQSIRKF